MNKVRKDYWMFQDHDDLLKKLSEIRRVSKSTVLAQIIEDWKKEQK